MESERPSRRFLVSMQNPCPRFGSFRLGWVNWVGELGGRGGGWGEGGSNQAARVAERQAALHPVLHQAVVARQVLRRPQVRRREDLGVLPPPSPAVSRHRPRRRDDAKRGVEVGPQSGGVRAGRRRTGAAATFLIWMRSREAIHWLPAPQVNS